MKAGVIMRHFLVVTDRHVFISIFLFFVFLFSGARFSFSSHFHWLIISAREGELLVQHRVELRSSPFLLPLDELEIVFGLDHAEIITLKALMVHTNI